MKKQKHNSTGFTLIELMLATVIFTFVMLVILASAFQIGRIYYKGISISNTDEAARTTVEDITNDARFANNATDPASYGSSHYFCVGLHRYTYVLARDQATPQKVTNDQINQIAKSPGNYPASIQAGIIQDQIPTGCPNPSTAGSDPTQLLGPDMQLNALDFGCPNGKCSLHVHILFYGADNTVFNSSAHPADTTSDHAAALKDSDAYCSGNLLSTQFCAVGDLQTSQLFRP